MRTCLLVTLLVLAPSSFAQEGAIEYQGSQTIQFSREFLLANLPEEMAADSAMVEAMLANMPADGVTMPMNWSTRFSGQTVTGGTNLADMMPGLGGGGAPAMTPFSGGMEQMISATTESFIDYENGIVVSAAPSFMEEPYIITQDLDSLLLPEWELVDQDSTLKGFAVRRAVTDLSPAALENMMSGMSAAGMGGGMEAESARFEVWYTPDLPSPAGPMSLGGLPGVVLHMRGEVSMQGSSIVMELSADSITTTLDSPVAPPSGMPIEAEDYMEIMKLRMEMMQQQMQGNQ